MDDIMKERDQIVRAIIDAVGKIYGNKAPTIPFTMALSIILNGLLIQVKGEEDGFQEQLRRAIASDILTEEQLKKLYPVKKTTKI